MVNILYKRYCKKHEGEVNQVNKKKENCKAIIVNICRQFMKIAILSHIKYYICL